MMFQSQEDKSHVSEQRLQGCRQRPWDHHLENRGERGWAHLPLVTQACYRQLSVSGQKQ